MDLKRPQVSYVSGAPSRSLFRSFCTRLQSGKSYLKARFCSRYHTRCYAKSHRLSTDPQPTHWPGRASLCEMPGSRESGKASI